jgi:tRNA modification GTPase
MLGDTIVAQASAPGTAERAVLRLSGPQALAAANLVFAPALLAQRQRRPGTVRVRGGEVAAAALVFVAPASFTGELVVELHLPGGPVLVRCVLEDLLVRGAALGVRAALPGEFTARACQNGRLDLAQAEGVLMLLHAADQQQAAAAVQWLRGGLSAAVVAIRSQLQDVLALLEVGLDFEEGEAGALREEEWAVPLASAVEAVRDLARAVPAASPGGEVLLLGAANVGKSSLCNALVGRRVALVAAAEGTTRDLLRIELAPGVAVWDAPGDLAVPGVFDATALALRDRLAGGAAAVLVMLDASAPRVPASALASPLPLLAIVWTRCDLVAEVPPLPMELAARLPVGVPVLATSAHRSRGLEELRTLLTGRARGGAAGAGGPLREAFAVVAAALERARQAVTQGPELAAVELQSALRALDEVDGSHSPEHLLDRIYGRFCLGK